MDTSETIWLLIGCALVLGYLALVVYFALDLVRRDLSGFAKAAWIVAFLVVPLLSVVFYFVTRGDDPRPYPGQGRPDVGN